MPIAPPPIYGLFIDEVGNACLKSSSNPNQRYLSLTGLVVAQADYVESFRDPVFELKKRHFNAEKSSDINLHRSELINRKDHFRCLLDPENEARFNQDLLALITNAKFHVLTVTIDKLRLCEQYQVWVAHPYHYCLKAMLERYVIFLSRRGAMGSVTVEGRGRTEDRCLSDSYSRLYSGGSEWVSAQKFQRTLRSKELKIQTKKDNNPILQICDLIAHPSWKAMMSIRDGLPWPETFGGQISKILEESKYDRFKGIVENYGRKWLP